MQGAPRGDRCAAASFVGAQGEGRAAHSRRTCHYSHVRACKCSYKPENACSLHWNADVSIATNTAGICSLTTHSEHWCLLALGMPLALMAWLLLLCGLLELCLYLSPVLFAYVYSIDGVFAACVCAVFCFADRGCRDFAMF